MQYRHVVEFENNAELSAIHIREGKIIVRVHSVSPDPVKYEVTKNHLFPLLCSQSEKNFIISASSRFKSVNRELWEMIDQLNRHGEYDLPGASEEAVRKMRIRINDALQSVGLKYRIISSGTVLKPEFVDLVAGI